MKTLNRRTISRLPASRFPDPAEIYFCDSCGRDLTKNLHQDRAPIWQPLRPMWYVCQCRRKYLSGAAEWDDLTAWERKQRLQQLSIGFVLFALLVIPGTLAYFALAYGGAAVLAVVGIALIPSILVARPFGFVLLDLYEIVASIWRTRLVARRVSPAVITELPTRRSRHELRLTPLAVVIAVFIIATRWIPSHHGPVAPAGTLSSPEGENAGLQEILFAPASAVMAHAAVTGAPSPAFRRVQVGPNEVDYIAEDVTIRHFMPTPARRRAQSTYKEVDIGADVTMRYFPSRPAVVPEARLASVDRRLPLPK